MTKEQFDQITSRLSHRLLSGMFDAGLDELLKMM